MSVRKSQARKQAKKKSREKRNRKVVNVRKNNLAPEQWVLKVLIDGAWREAMRFRSRSGITRHKEETEKLRKAGQLIVPGKVFDMNTGKVVLSIEGSDKKGIVPDKMAGNEAAADKAKPGFLKRVLSKGHGDVSKEI